jgi:hypothetical protein
MQIFVIIISVNAQPSSLAVKAKLMRTLSPSPSRGAQCYAGFVLTFCARACLLQRERAMHLGGMEEVQTKKKIS